jgi:hypothetical protein
VRVRALAVAAGAVTIPRLRHVPVLVAVGRVAVLAESRVVVEPGDVDLGEGQERAERFGDPLRPAGIYEVAVAVVGGDALEDEIPLSWLPIQQEGALHRAGPLPFGGYVSGVKASWRVKAVVGPTSQTAT